VQFVRIPFLISNTSTDEVDITYSSTLSNENMNHLPIKFYNPNNEKLGLVSTITTKENFKDYKCQSFQFWFKTNNNKNDLGASRIEVGYGDEGNYFAIGFNPGYTILLGDTSRKLTLYMHKADGTSISLTEDSHKWIKDEWNNLFISKERTNEDTYNLVVYLNGEKIFDGFISDSKEQGYDISRNVFNYIKFTSPYNGIKLSEMTIYGNNYIASEKDIKRAMFTPSVHYKFDTPVENFVNNLTDKGFHINEALLNRLGITYESESLDEQFENHKITRVNLTGFDGNVTNINPEGLPSKYLNGIKLLPKKNLFNGEKKLGVEFNILYGINIDDPSDYWFHLYGDVKSYYRDASYASGRIVCALYDYINDRVLFTLDSEATQVNNFDDDAPLFKLSKEEFGRFCDVSDAMVLLIFDYSNNNLIDICNIEMCDYYEYQDNIKQYVSGIFTQIGDYDTNCKGMGFRYENLIKNISTDMYIYDKAAKFYEVIETNDGQGQTGIDSLRYPIKSNYRTHPTFFESELFRCNFFNSAGAELYAGWKRPRPIVRIKAYTNALPIIKLDSNSQDLTFTHGFLGRCIDFPSMEFHYSGAAKLKSEEIPATDYLYGKKLSDILSVTIVPLVDDITIDIKISIVDEDLKDTVKYMNVKNQDVSLTDGIIPFANHTIRGFSLLMNKQSNVTVTFYDENQNEIGEYYLFKETWKLMGNKVYPSTVNKQYTDIMHLSINESLNLLSDTSSFSLDFCSPLLINKYSELPISSLNKNVDTSVYDLSGNYNQGEWLYNYTPKYSYDGGGCYHWTNTDCGYLQPCENIYFEPDKDMACFWFKAPHNPNQDCVFLEIGKTGSYVLKVRVKYKDFIGEVYNKNGEFVTSLKMENAFQPDVWNLVVLDKMYIWVNDKLFDFGTVVRTAVSVGIDYLNYVKIGLTTEPLGQDIDFKITEMKLVHSFRGMTFMKEHAQFLYDEKVVPRFDNLGHISGYTFVEEENSVGVTPYGGFIANSFEEKEDNTNEDIKISLGKNIVSTEIIER